MASYCIASVQHTGTWFTIKTVSRLLNYPISTGTIFTLPSSESEDFVQYIKDWQTPLYHLHFGLPDECDMMDSILPHYKVIIPIRDPLLSLISRENRHPELAPHEFIIDGFLYLAQLHKMNPKNIFLFPVDLYKTRDDRKKLLLKLSDFLGIRNTERRARIINFTLSHWDKPVNPSPDDYSGLKKLYQNDETRLVFNFLLNNRYGDNRISDKMILIREFLKSLGYDQLPWFDLV